MKTTRGVIIAELEAEEALAFPSRALAEAYCQGIETGSDLYGGSATFLFEADIEKNDLELDPPTIASARAMLADLAKESS